MSGLADERLRVTALPSWAVYGPFDPKAAAGNADVSDGLQVLLRDTQVDLTGEAPAEFVRLLYRIVTQTGAEHAARFSALFDPALQRIEVHHVRVIRGEAVIEHARPGNFDLMRREQNLERRVLDGRLTASLIIPDVRPGDVIEQCWTITGGTPVLRRCYGDWVPFEGDVAEIRQRLRAPASRRFATRAHGAPPEYSERTEGDVIDRQWRVGDCKSVEIENLTPSWQVLSRSLQIAEEKSWADIAALFAPVYQAGGLTDALRQEAEAIRARHRDAAGRMLAALKLVRERLRYLSLSLGEGGLIPRPVEQVWATGYGDCKDAARLFVGLCGLLEVEAVCALVHTRYGPVLKDWLPSAGVFDHCIARARIDGKTYWIDPTRRALEPSLAHLFNPHVGWALPLVPEGGALEEMPLPEPPLIMDKYETLRFGKRVSTPATLELRIVYESINADWMRALVANQGLADVSKRFLERYQENWRGISEKEPLRVEDDETANRVTVRGLYSVRDIWKEEGEVVACIVSAQEIAHDLASLQLKGERENHVYLGVVRSLRRRLEIEMPRKIPYDFRDDVKRVQGLKFWDKLLLPEKKLVIQEQELTISAPSCPPEQAFAYAEIARELGERSGLIIRLPFRGDKFKGEPVFGKLGWGGWLYSIWLILALLAWLFNTVSLAPR